MLTFLCFLAGCGVSGVLGVVFSQRVKDWAAGVPAALRADLAKLEAKAVAEFKAKTGIV